MDDKNECFVPFVQIGKSDACKSLTCACMCTSALACSMVWTRDTSRSRQHSSGYYGDTGALGRYNLQSIQHTRVVIMIILRHSCVCSRDSCNVCPMLYRTVRIIIISIFRLVLILFVLYNSSPCSRRRHK